MVMCSVEFVIGRNKQCDFIFTSHYISRLHCEILRVPPHGTLIIKNLKDTNFTYVEDLVLQDVNNFAELRRGSRIGLGVPLVHAKNDNLSNKNFVFLKLCQDDPDSSNEKLEHTVLYAEVSNNEQSLLNNSSGIQAMAHKNAPVNHIRTQFTNEYSGNRLDQPGSSKQGSDVLDPLTSCSGFTSGSASYPVLQNQETRPFPSLPHGPTMPSLRQAPQSKPLTQCVSQLENRIQEPLSELHLQNKYHERSHVLHVNRSNSALNTVYPNQMVALPSKVQTDLQIQSEVQSHSLEHDAAVSRYNPQQWNYPASGPHQHSQCRLDNVHASGTLTKNASEIFHQIDLRQMDSASGSQYKEVFSKLNSKSGMSHIPESSKSWQRYSQNTIVSSQAQETRKSVSAVCEAVMHPTFSPESTSFSLNLEIESCNQSSNMQIVSSAYRGVDSEPKSLVPRSSKLQVHGQQTQDAQQTESSVLVAPMQVPSSKELLIESDSSHGSSTIPSIHQLTKHPGNALSLHEVSETSVNVQPNKNFGARQSQQTLESKIDKVSSEAFEEHNSTVEPRVSPDKSTTTVFYTKGDNSGIECSSIGTKNDSLANRSTLENIGGTPTHKDDHISIDMDNSDLPISIDLTEPEPESMTVTECVNEVKNMNCDKDSEHIKCRIADEDISVISEIIDTSAAMEDLSVKRKRKTTEKSSEEISDSAENHINNVKKVKLSESPRLLNNVEENIANSHQTELQLDHRKPKSSETIQIDSDCDSFKALESSKNELPMHHGKTKKSKRTIIDSDSDSSKDLERSEAEFQMQCHKIKRSKGKIINSNSDSSNDLESSEMELQMQRRRTKRCRAIIINSDSDSTEESSDKPDKNVEPRGIETKSLAVKRIGIKATLNDWKYKTCSVSVERLPPSIVGASKDKVVIPSEHKNMPLKSAVPQINKKNSEGGMNKLFKDSRITLDDDLPDVNISCVSKEMSHSLSLFSESRESENKIASYPRNARENQRKHKGENLRDIKTDVPEEQLESQKNYSRLQRDKKDQFSGTCENQPLSRQKDSMNKKGPLSTGTEDGTALHDKGYNKDESSVTGRHTSTSFSTSETFTRNNNSKLCHSKDIRLNKETDISDVGSRNILTKSSLPPMVTVKTEKTEEPNVEEIKIKKEKIEDSENNGISIKKEFNDNPTQVQDKTVDGDDEDDIICMYSQVDETIWVSSDEDEMPSQDVSFGPLPSSPDLDIEELFRDDEQELNQDVTNTSKNDAPEEGKALNDDHWFPVLSQSFFDDDDSDKDTDSKGSKSADSSSLDSLPGPSGINSVEDEDWWPVLSQEILDEIAADKVDDTYKSDQRSSDSSKNLEAIIEKLKNKEKRTSQLTDPKLPPQRRRRSTSQETSRVQSPESTIDNVESASKSNKNDSKKEEWISTSKKSEKLTVQTITVPAWQKIVGPQKKKSKNRSHLRDNLTSKFNLESYKATLEHKPREKHHLIPKIKEDQSAKANDRRHNYHRKSHLVTDKPRAGENISVQRKNVQDDSSKKEKPRPKVAAKVTKKTRSERLIDIDIFSSAAPLPKPRKVNYKIPRNTEKEDSKNLKSQACDASETHMNSGSGVVLAKPRVSTSNTTSSLGMQPKNIITSGDNNKENADLLQQTSEEVRNANDIEKPQKGILRLFIPKSGTKEKKVHFPQKSEDLVNALLISPRKDSDKAGKLEVRAREILPRELLIQKYHLPPNYMEYFIYHICRWNYDWLDVYRIGQEKNEASGKGGAVPPPPVATSTNYPTLILYSSYNDYKEIFSNLMYLEVWENVYQDWLKYRLSNIWLPTQIDVVNQAFIEDGKSPLKFWGINMVTIITQNQSNRGLHPRQGSLISLRIQEGVKKMTIFGYVDHFTKNRKRLMTRELEQACPNGEICLMMAVRVTKKDILIVKSGQIIWISNVSYIRPSTRIWEGLCKLPLSPLFSDFLKPTEAAFACSRECGQYLVDGMSLNDVQRKAVVEVSSKCVLSYNVPKLSLIHGPPGTGKTRTITAIIAQIIKMSYKRGLPFCRILLCAPSNAAVNELTLRLLKLKEIGICLRVVRVGVRESINPEIKECHLDSFVQKQVKLELSSPKNLSTKQEWDRRKAMVEEAAESLQNARKDNMSKEDIKSLENRLTELARAKADFERSFHSQPSAQERYQLQQKWQQQILLNAEVITTTLGGCLSGAMSDVFSNTPHGFTCCIIDEAGQCTEMETWLPLLLKVHKLVLVGDHRQLPATVLSQLAQNKNLKQSLFERLYHRFIVELQLDNMVHTLNVQYRMHPEIAAWPAQHFYSDRLLTSPHIIDERNCDLKPYIVFDLKTSQEQKGHNSELFNPAEASLVRLIIEVLEPLVGNQKIGVITPYQRQKIYLEEKLAKFFGRMSLTVNTIDAFQGQERDIIILSFVRGNSGANIGFLSQRQRLNVALTRARKSCFIVASLSSLSNNKDWESLIKNAERRGLISVITGKEEGNKSYIKSVLLK
ncbi:uncharacterized protein [Cherax quadricarinatus]|uniref:uncharacterized protein isoform X2 n=1 Tax=Cherax quadricarinatus TaxID=27406 RepID=UPI00387E3964